METFTVEAVIDANTFIISPPWKLDDETGDTIRATGYNPPKSGSNAMKAEQKISIMIQNKQIELAKPHGIERGKLVCEVYFNGVDLADYFPEYKDQE